MTNRSPIFDVVSALDRAVAARNWGAADVEIELSVEEMVSALVTGAVADVVAAAPLIERIYAGMRASQSDLEGDAAVTCGQLRTLTTLAGAACGLPNTAPTPLNDPTIRPILDALFEAEERTGRELAAATGWAEETIARKLPVLRQTGAVVSRRSGRSTLNRLSDDARQRLVQAKSLPAKAPEAGSRGPFTEVVTYNLDIHGALLGVDTASKIGDATIMGMKPGISPLPLNRSLKKGIGDVTNSKTNPSSGSARPR